MDLQLLEKEVKYRFSRSSGSGGQHVNKVSTRVELLFDVFHTDLLNEEQKARVLERLKGRISKEGILRIAAQNSRSQLVNKAVALNTFKQLMQNALLPPPQRKKVKTWQAHPKKRLEKKRRQAEKKANRKKVTLKNWSDLFL